MPVNTLAVKPVTTPPDTSVREAARIMRDEDLGDLIVVEDRKPIGIITDRDIALAVAVHDDFDDLTVDDLMTPDPVTIHEDDTATELPETMARGKIRRIPVVDDAGDLVGIATLDDVVATIGEMMKDVATVIEWQSREYREDAQTA